MTTNFTQNFSSKNELPSRNFQGFQINSLNFIQIKFGNLKQQCSFRINS